MTILREGLSVPDRPCLLRLGLARAFREGLFSGSRFVPVPATASLLFGMLSWRLRGTFRGHSNYFLWFGYDGPP